MISYACKLIYQLVVPAIAVLWCIGACPPAYSNSLEITPTLLVGAIHESNPRLRTEDEDDATGLRTTGHLDILWASPNTSLSVRPKANLTFYQDSDDEDLEDEEYSVDSNVTHQAEISEYSFAASYANQSVRTSELESAGDDSGSGSGRIVRADDSRQTLRLGPGWLRRFGERNAVRGSVRYTDVDFDKDTDETGRLPYEFWTGDMSFDRHLTTKTSGGMVFSFTRYESATSSNNIKNETSTYGTSLYANYSFTEKLSGAAYGGFRTSDIEITREPIAGTAFCISANVLLVPCTEKFSDNNFVGELSLKLTEEAQHYTVSVSRSVTPNSNGAETIRDTFDAVFFKQLGRRASGSIGLLYYKQEDVANLTNRQRDYISARVNFNWQLTELWSLDSYYRYVEDQDDTLTGIQEDATNHYVYVGFRYKGRGWRN